MGFDALGDNAPFILLIIGLIVLQLFLRRRRNPEVTQGDITRNLLSEVRINLALVETYGLRQKPKRFETVSWQRNKDKLDFLSRPLRGNLADAFRVAEDFNQQIQSAKKFKTASYIVSIDADRMKGSLSKSRDGLEEWLMAKTGTKETVPKYPGMFDDFFGGRR